MTKSKPMQIAKTTEKAASPHKSKVRSAAHKAMGGRY